MSDHCQEFLMIETGEVDNQLLIFCELLTVDSRGVPRGHIHHRRTHDVPGVEKAVTTWTRRP